MEELEQEELDAKMLETPSPVVSAPNVPKNMPGKIGKIYILIIILTILIVYNKTVVEEDDEEAELRALQASIAM